MQAPGEDHMAMSTGEAQTGLDRWEKTKAQEWVGREGRDGSGGGGFGGGSNREYLGSKRVKSHHAKFSNN